MINISSNTQNEAYTAFKRACFQNMSFLLLTYKLVSEFLKSLDEQEHNLYTYSVKTRQMKT
nr:MAG TPA: hypothetical protein [Caudoviricetes sp.]